MATKTTTTYTCDGCGKDTKAGDLRRFTLTESKLIGSSARDKHVADARTDLCAACERKLHSAASPLFSSKEWEQLEGIVRG